MWKSFGWSVIEIDGHDIRELLVAFHRAKQMRNPTAIIAYTVKGKGTVSRSRSLVTVTTALASSSKKRSSFLSFFSTFSRKESFTVVFLAVIEIFIEVPLSFDPSRESFDVDLLITVYHRNALLTNKSYDLTCFPSRNTETGRSKPESGSRG